MLTAACEEYSTPPLPPLKCLLISLKIIALLQKLSLRVLALKLDYRMAAPALCDTESASGSVWLLHVMPFFILLSFIGLKYAGLCEIKRRDACLPISRG